MNKFNILYISLALATNFLAIYILSLRYKAVINLMGRQLSIFHSLVILIVSQLTTYIVPFKLGPILTKPAMTRKYSDVSLNQSIGATIFEQFADLFLHIILLLFILIFLFNKKASSHMLFQSIMITAVITTCIVIFILFRKKAIAYVWSYRSIAPGIVKKFGKKLNLSQESMQNVINETLQYFTKPDILLTFMAYSIVIFFILPFILQFCVMIFSKNITYYQVFLVYWVSMIVGRLSGIPGGFGSRDLTCGGLLIVYGVNTYDSLQIVIWQRVLSLVPYFLIGGPLLYYYSKDLIVNYRNKNS